MRLVCGLLVRPDDGLSLDIAEKARSLTISWLRWSYFGEIIEGSTVDEILSRSAEKGFDFCFIQAAGHILPDHWSPKQEESLEFFHSLRQYIESADFLVSGVPNADGDGLLDRWLVVDLANHHKVGRPRFEGAPKGAAFIVATRDLGLPISTLDPTTRSLMLDLGPDLKGSDFLEGLASRSERCARGVFPWNFESYDDVIEAPVGWNTPISTLYSVAAGLKPNMILRVHGFDDATEVVYFDYSGPALDFQKLLHEEWDGCDYPHFLKFALTRLPSDTYYYLWPGASLDDADSPEMQALWQREIARWGGEQALRLHWERTRALKHTYIACNLLTGPEVLVNRIADSAGAVLWWSNSFHTAFTACNYTVDGKRAVYESWIRSLTEKAPNLLLYGSDHSNSSVNGMGAAEYWAAYQKAGGDPLAERRLHQRVIRF